MADIAITAANVKKGVGAVTKNVVYGGTITQGMVLYEKSSDSEWYAVDADDSIAAYTPLGIALTAGADGQPGIVQIAGEITAGGTLVAGSAYYCSATTAGSFAADLPVAGDYSTLVGIAKTTAIMLLALTAQGTVTAAL